MKNLSLLSMVGLLTLWSCAKDYSSAEWKKWKKDSVEYFPKQTWMMYAAPEEAGWSSEKLNQARESFERSSSSALVVIYNGMFLSTGVKPGGGL